jgi:hypothetical protein
VPPERNSGPNGRAGIGKVLQVSGGVRELERCFQSENISHKATVIAL